MHSSTEHHVLIKIVFYIIFADNLSLIFFVWAFFEGIKRVGFYRVVLWVFLMIKSLKHPISLRFLEFIWLIFALICPVLTRFIFVLGRLLRQCRRLRWSFGVSSLSTLSWAYKPLIKISAAPDAHHLLLQCEVCFCDDRLYLAFGTWEEILVSRAIMLLTIT